VVKSDVFQDEEITPTLWSVKAKATVKTFLITVTKALDYSVSMALMVTPGIVMTANFPQNGIPQL